MQNEIIEDNFPPELEILEIPISKAQYNRILEEIDGEK